MEKLEQLGKKRSGVLEAGVVALTLLGAHEKLQAAEIAPTASWEEGISEIRRNVREDPYEIGATFVVRDDNAVSWLPTIQGTLGGASKPIKVMARQLEKISNGGQVTNVCDLHSHPTQSIENEFGVNGRFAPPSLGDAYVFSRGGRQVVLPERAAELGVSVGSVTAAVFDPSGVWYFRTLTEEERSTYPTPPGKIGRQLEDNFEKSMSGFVERSATPSTFNFNDEYDKLKNLYRENLRIEIRFTSYEQIKNEPPCAGPDYVPQK